MAAPETPESHAVLADSDPPRVAVVDAVTRALAEDLLPLGDLTSALVPPDATAAMAIVSRAHGVIAGGACADEAFRQIDPNLQVTWSVPDGGGVDPGTLVAEISGRLRSILTAERTVLNFLGHLSGVASLTRRYVDAVAATNSRTRILDTRKTTPGLRSLEKAAVRAGGGRNHRGSLSDAVLVKDNHLGGLSIADGVARAQQLWPGRMVEVECDRPDQVDEAVAAGATVIMLDNMSLEEVASCVSRLRADGVGTLIEVSGRVSIDEAPGLAAAGADLISVGALTHSAPVLDLGFDLVSSSMGRN